MASSRSLQTERTKVVETWLVKLTVDVTAYIEVPRDCPEDAVGMLAVDSVSLFPSGDDAVTLEVDNAGITDIVRLAQREKD